MTNTIPDGALPGDEPEAEFRRPLKPLIEIAPDMVAAIDAVILSAVDGEWRKVALVVARATDAAKAQALDVPAQAIAQRIYALTDNKRLVVQGNVRRWRAGEVRLPS